MVIFLLLVETLTLQPDRNCICHDLTLEAGSGTGDVFEEFKDINDDT